MSNSSCEIKKCEAVIMQTADNVARWFLSREAARAVSGETDFISNLKLQKLPKCAEKPLALAMGMKSAKKS